MMYIVGSIIWRKFAQKEAELKQFELQLVRNLPELLFFQKHSLDYGPMASKFRTIAFILPPCFQNFFVGQLAGMCITPNRLKTSF